MKKFVTVATFTYQQEYAVLKLLLDKEGIPYIFENETMVAVSPFYSNALGGIKLKVHESDVTATKEIIENLERGIPPLHIV